MQTEHADVRAGGEVNGRSSRTSERTAEALNTAILPSTVVLERRIEGLSGSHQPAARAGQAVFLHTGWRSGGTWIWSRCRAYAQVHGYYEPLHEHAARFRRRDVETMRPGSWQSNHSETAPYFEEFRDLIPAHGRGVALYQPRFAFDGFFRAPDDPADPALESYLSSLMAGPVAQGRLPVLKFCRSMGRVGWFERRFPDALHAVVLRNPVAQYESGQRLLQDQRNRYFALAPMLVLARNARNPAVREAALALGVNIPTLYSDDMDYAVEACWLHVRRLSPAEHYRGFLAFWTLCATAALDSEALVIDLDAIATDLEHRRDVETALQVRIGEPIQLVPRARSASDLAPPPAGWREAHGAAEVLVLTRRDRLSAARMDIILEKLAGGTPGSWLTPRLPDAQRPGSFPRRTLTAAEILLARAMQPLRRLHGTLAKRDILKT